MKHESLPAWGVWIEIFPCFTIKLDIVRHSPHGECGLKSHVLVHPIVPVSHSPHGECGLKCRCHLS